MKQLIGLQYLRGVAAFGVVLYHFTPQLTGRYEINKFLIETGAGGVDVFFVISGYIIWLTTQGAKPCSWWCARLVRIVPLYWLALVATLAIYAAEGHTMPGVWESVRSFLFVPTLNSRTHDFSPVLVQGWTLNYEFFFYLVLAGALFIPRAITRLIVICGAFGALVALRHFIDQSNAIQFRLTSPLLFEFVAGIGIAVGSPYVTRGRGFLGIVAITGAVLYLCLISPRLFPGPRILYFGVPAALLVFGVVCLEDALRKHLIAPLKLLGDASYSLYLTHTLTAGLVLWLMARMGIELPLLRYAIVVISTTLMGILIFKCVEKPLLRLMRGRTHTLPVRATA